MQEVESTLRAFAKAYPVEIFSEPKPQSKDDALMVSLGAAAMGRHMAASMLAAADNIAALEDMIRRLLPLAKNWMAQFPTGNAQADAFNDALVTDAVVLLGGNDGVEE